jgi:hypothetical protein
MNWLLEINHNNSYFPSITPLRHSSSSALCLLEQQCLQSKQRQKRKQILIVHYQQQLLLNEINKFYPIQSIILLTCLMNIFIIENSFMFSLTFIQHQKHKKRFSSNSSLFFFIMRDYIFPIFLKSFFLFNIYSQ